MLGAVVAPTDAVAAVATFARVRVPERVRLLVQGESLINDATGLTAFRVALARPPPRASRCGDALVEFVLAAVGGAVVGDRRGVGRSCARSGSQPDVTVSVLLTVLAAYASYIAAEEIARLGHPRRGRLRRLQRLAPVGVLRRRHAPDRHRVLEDHGLRAGGAAVHPARAAAGVGRRARSATPRPARCWPTGVAARGAGDRRAGGLRAAAARPRASACASGSSSAGAACAARSRSPPRSSIDGRHPRAAPRSIFLTFVVILVTLVGQGLTLPALVKALRLPDEREWSPEEAIARLEAAQSRARPARRARGGAPHRRGAAAAPARPLPRPLPPVRGRDRRREGAGRRWRSSGCATATCAAT